MNVYEIITERITEKLQAGTVPWQKPWNALEGMPKNLVSGKEYRGINPFILHSAGYESPYFVTFKQALDRGGAVRKGEKGLPVVFWKFLDHVTENTETGETENKRAPMLRYYTVFNVSQCDGISAPASVLIDHLFTPIETCEKIVSAMPNAPGILHGSHGAFYRPGADHVSMPNRERFEKPEMYYSTLFHELTHSTGHENRLNRKTLTDLCPFGSTNYSKEELIAEMGAAFLCGHAGIENVTVDNSAAYIQSWLGSLRNDPKMVVMAAAQAQKASDLILNKSYEPKGETA